jgi:hypothetical protein
MEQFYGIFYPDGDFSIFIFSLAEEIAISTADNMDHRVI